MAYLLGYSSISRRATSGVIPTIARSHPLARGLLAAYYPAVFPGGTITNLATPGSGDLTTRTGGFLGATQEGPGLDCSAAATENAAISGNTPTQFQMATGQSAFVRGKWTGYTGSNSQDTLIGIIYNAAPFYAWAIVNSPPVANGGVANTIAYVCDLGSTTFINNFGATVTPGNGNMFSGGFVGISGASKNKLYLNGIPQANTTPEGTGMNANHYGSLAPTIVLGNVNATRTGASILTVGYIWNRILSAGEMLYMHQNPYSLLRWPIDVVYDVLEQPAGAPPVGTATSKAMILSPLTVGGAALEWLGRRKIKIAQIESFKDKYGIDPFELAKQIEDDEAAARASQMRRELGYE